MEAGNGGVRVVTSGFGHGWGLTGSPSLTALGNREPLHMPLPGTHSGLTAHQSAPNCLLHCCCGEVLPDGHSGPVFNSLKAGQNLGPYDTV